MAEIKSLAFRAAAAPLALLFPPGCPGCRRPVAAPGAVCPECWRGLALIEKPYCAILGTPFPYEMEAGAVSPEAIADPPPFARARAAVAYQGVARDMVRALKYRDHTDLAPWMARWMLRAGAELIRDAELVVPVPLHRRRFFLRRFNQSAELARAIALQSGLPFAPEAAQRIRPTRQQVGLALREREENVRGAFRVPEAAKPTVKGRRVLLVDDVYTTGATVSALTRALKRGGTATVDVLTFARVLGGDFRAAETGTI